MEDGGKGIEPGRGIHTVDELHLCLCHLDPLFRAYLRFAREGRPTLALTKKCSAGRDW